MRYQVRQITDYSYARPVVFAQHVLRIVPVDRPGQTVSRCDDRHHAGAGDAARRHRLLRQPAHLPRFRPAAPVS
jgi:hypothetical protein